jgi:hypothetical protein
MAVRHKAATIEDVIANAHSFLRDGTIDGRRDQRPTGGYARGPA